MAHTGEWLCVNLCNVRIEEAPKSTHKVEDGRTDGRARNSKPQTTRPPVQAKQIGANLSTA